MFSRLLHKEQLFRVKETQNAKINKYPKGKISLCPKQPPQKEFRPLIWASGAGRLQVGRKCRHLSPYSIGILFCTCLLVDQWDVISRSPRIVPSKSLHLATSSGKFNLTMIHWEVTCADSWQPSYPECTSQPPNQLANSELPCKQVWTCCSSFLGMP